MYFGSSSGYSGIDARGLWFVIVLVVVVEFHSGGTHQFGPLTKEQFASFRDAESIGKHYHAHVRAKAIK